MTIKLWLALFAALGLTFGAAAHAEIRDLRFGAVAHNVLDQYNREESINYEAEIVFDSPAILELIGHPRPYVMVSINDSDYTSFGGVGLYWRWEFADGRSGRAICVSVSRGLKRALSRPGKAL